MGGDAKSSPGIPSQASGHTSPYDPSKLLANNHGKTLFNPFLRGATKSSPGLSQASGHALKYGYEWVLQALAPPAGAAQRLLVPGEVLLMRSLARLAGQRGLPSMHPSMAS